MTEEKNGMDRRLTVLGALLIQVSLGAIYIYSVFKPALKVHFTDWTPTDLALPSQLVLAFFALSMIFAGRIQDKVGPRIIARVGAILLGAGLVIASFAENLGMFVLGFSIIGGTGIGAAYVCPIATCVKWFPDKRGLVAGLAVAGFGAGGLVFTPVAKSLIANRGIMPTFLYLGLIFFVLVFIGAQFMVNPPAGYKPKGWNPPQPAAGQASAIKVDFSWKDMLKTTQFWPMWFTYFAGCTAGLMILMNVTNIWDSIALSSLNDISSTVSRESYEEVILQGAMACMIAAILNAVGRIAWGKTSDMIGRRLTLFIMFSYAGIIMLLLNFFRTYESFLFGVASIGFCFGGFLAIYPALTADFFGTKNVGGNYGLMFTAYGVAGLFGPWLAPKLMKVVEYAPCETIDKSGALITNTFEVGNYATSFIISGLLCIIAAGLIIVLKSPSIKTQQP